MPFSLYIVRCGDGSLYTGIAKNVTQRLAEHRSGVRGAKYLRGRMPIELVFECEAGDRGDALRLERSVKRLSKAAKEALIAGEFELGTAAGVLAAQASGVSSG